jgi:putative nucleotidyltransferase with HDIG domain
LRRVAVAPGLAGQILAKTIYGDGGSILVRAGTKLQEPLIRSMLRRGIATVWVVNDLLPDLDVPEPISERTRAAALAELRSAQGSMMQGGRPEAPLVGLQRALEGVMGEILTNTDVVLNMARLRSFDDYTYEHSLQTAVLAMGLGRDLGLDEYQLLRLGTGAILHDIGKARIPEEIVRKPGVFTSEEYEVMKTHARLGWQMVMAYETIMPTSAIVVLQHHERLDGSGYPSGLEGARLHLHSRIAAVADVFDAMRADQSYRPRLNPADIVRELEWEAEERLDRTIVAVLLRRWAVVSQGEIVRLSDGSLAVVEGHNPGNPLKPRVILMADPEAQPLLPTSCNLAETDLSVTAVLDDWPPGFRQSGQV